MPNLNPKLFLKEEFVLAVKETCLHSQKTVEATWLKHLEKEHFMTQLQDNVTSTHENICQHISKGHF